MNILLVDDERSAIDMLLHRISWEKFCFDHIFTAQSMDEARKILDRETVEILLCDIEMPGGSGFTLMAWVRRQGIAVECIFLTCYADFSYAREALKLGSVDYILKPVIPEEVEGAIEKAISRHRAPRDMNRGNLHRHSRFAYYRQFWMELLDGTLEADVERISEYVEKKQLDISVEACFFGVVITAVLNPPSLSRIQRGWLLKGQKWLESSSSILGCRCHLLPQNDKSFFVILESVAGACVLQEEAENLCHRFLDLAKEDTGVRCYCYLGQACGIAELPNQVEDLLTKAYQNVVLDTQILYLHSVPVPSARPLDMPVSRWENLLLAGGYMECYEEIRQYLGQPSVKRRITLDFLHQFSLEYYQMLVTHAYRNQILLTSIFSLEECADYVAQATASLAGMLVWVEYSLQTLEDAVRDKNREWTPTEQIKAYVSRHIREALTVSAISDYVHMNSSYLARLFKKETGSSIHQYIQEQKITLAMQDMRTSKPIGEIALELGYQSYSSFQKTFTKIAGLSPKEYKNKLIGGDVREK